MPIPILAPGQGRIPSRCRFKQDLSVYRRTLLQIMQSINFGRIEGLQICDCEPVLDPSPVVVREHKFGGENGPRPELDAADFPLKRQIVELFDYFDAIGHGTIDLLEIKHGLPFRMVVTEAPA